jgi:hypothetical protein
VADSEVRDLIQAVVDDPNYAGLKFYRNLAAHRGVMGEQQRGGQVEEVGVDGVHFMLPDWLPMEAPDHPNYSIRPILRRYLEWGRPALAEHQEFDVLLILWATSSSEETTDEEVQEREQHGVSFR